MILTVVFGILQGILSLIPADPFQSFISGLSIPYINYVNWFIPLDKIVAILSAWITAILLFYAVQALLRYTKAIAG